MVGGINLKFVLIKFKMGREIKFRGFSKRQKNYVYGYYWYNPFEKKHIIKHIIEGGTQLEDVECTVIEQYTGIKDKNGVEIYEGDLLQHYNSIIKPFVVNWDEELVSFVFEDGYTSYILTDKSFSVVGNVNENPELLEVN
jgi:uncharacterized phage protein (TIGR01671 family)